MFLKQILHLQYPGVGADRSLAFRSGHDLQHGGLLLQFIEQGQV